MSSIFCCSNTNPYKNRALSHEPKFKPFMSWAAYPKESNLTTFDAPSSPTASTFAVQIVQQTNLGPLDPKRYFVSTSAGGEFVEVTEQWLIDANFQKLKTFKNFKCRSHNKFLAVDLYQKDLVNAHHWRVDVA